MEELAGPAGVDGAAPDAGTGGPWAGYDEQTVKEITGRIADLDDDARAGVREYEQAHKKRAGVLKAAKRSAA
jgi:hypothetical protein